MSLGPFFATLQSNDTRAFLQISRDWRSVLRFHFLHAALDAGLLQALREPCTVEALTRELGARRPDLLEALLELGTSLGELRRRGDRIELKGHRSRALADLRNDALAAMVQANVTYYNAAYRHLAHRLTGGPLGEQPRSFGPLVARLSRITEPYMAHYLGKALQGRGAVRVLDVGCGSGTHLRCALETHPDSTGVGLEVDGEVVKQAGDNLALWDLEGRARVVEGQAADLPAGVDGDFDLILLLSVVYYVPVEERVELFSTLRARLTPGGALLLATSCRGGGVDLFSANLNVATTSMEGLTELPTLEETEAQLRKAGFTELGRTRLVPRTAYYGLTAS